MTDPTGCICEYRTSYFPVLLIRPFATITGRCLYNDLMNESAGEFCFNLAFVFDANQTPAPDDLGQVCKTGIYRSIRQVEFSKFQTINTEK